METLNPASMQCSTLSRPAKRRRVLAPAEAASMRMLRYCIRCPPHPGSLSGFCINCGEHTAESHVGDGDPGAALIPFEYIKKGLALSNDFANVLRKESGENLMKRRRLVLVLDLDQTLLHSQACDSTVKKPKVAPRKDLFQIADHTTTKLRPYARHLLSVLEPLYNMYIYTMGSRSYASDMAALLDPKGRYFRNKVICREDSTVCGTKALDMVLAPAEAVVIVDDKELVWRRWKDRCQIINVKRYHYAGFSSGVGGDGTAAAGEGGEVDDDCSLLYATDALIKIHKDFFSSRSEGGDSQQGGVSGVESSGRDVREVMRSMRHGILRGCQIFIGDAFPAELKEALRGIAKRLGADYSKKLDKDMVTHVVVREQGTREAEWAIANHKHVVSVGWLDEAYRNWMRPMEADFPPPPSARK